MDRDPPLPRWLPRPRSVRRTGERVSLTAAFAARGAPHGSRAPELVQDACARRGLAPAGGAPELVFERDASLADEAYRLELAPAGARLHAAGARGFARGAASLAQAVLDAPLRAGALELPGFALDDAPALARRGVMLDVSRDRVPTMETLERLVALMALWKLNELQLYTEHAFAYPGHEEVWRASGALTPDEVRRLDRLCRAHAIELVPNQQCFGHMHRWLSHARYRPLAECPEGLEHPFSRRPEPFSLCPLDPRSLELVVGLLDGLLPCFESRELHVGLDETFDLGRGRSRAACEARGVGAVHMDFLCALHERVRARGRRMWFWADVVLHHPEEHARLPRDGVACSWGYEAAHDFDAELARLAAVGVPSVACPGTSSWKSFAGRPGTMARNVARAAAAARRHGALGLLVTDWGDQGHLQPLPASFPGWAAAAARAWSADDAPPALDELAAALERDALGGLSGAAQALWELGRAGEDVAPVPNATAPFQLLLRPERFPPPGVPALADERLGAALDAIERARGRVASPGDEEQRLVADELAWTADAQALGCRLGRARLAAAGAPPEALPDAARVALADELERLLAGHRRLWPRRSRPEGLEDSAAWLEPLRAALTRNRPAANAPASRA